MKETVSAVVKKIPGGMQVEASSRSFTILIDEPPELGGTDKAMTPLEAVLCALGSCQTIVAFAFAQSQGIDLKGLNIELEGDIDPDGFMGKDPNVRNGFSEVRFKMNFESGASKEDVEKFADFVKSRCPVGDIVENKVPLVRSGITIK